MQTLLAVPRVAWVNLPPFTWGHAGWPCFYHLAVPCFILLSGATLFFLAHLQLPALLCSPPDYTNKALLGRHASCQGENKPKESCCACHLLSWQEQDVNFCKGSCSKKSVPQAWQERRGQQRLNGGLICKRPWVELVLFPSATCLRVCLIISAYSESFLFFHSDLNTVL